MNFKFGQENPWQMDQKNIKNYSKIKVFSKMSVIDRTGWKENVQDLINLIQLLVAISVKALRDILNQNTL